MNFNKSPKKVDGDKVTLKYTNVDITKLSFTDLEESERSKGQKIAYPRYDHPKFGIKCPLCIQIPWIDLNSYGVPKLGDYYKEDSQRLFVKIPLDQSNPDCKSFSDFIRSIDLQLSSPDIAKKILGQKIAHKYKYQPIFRLPIEDEEDDDDTNKSKKKKNYGPKHPYMKLKLDYGYPDLNIKSKVFISSKDPLTNEKIRTKVNDIESIDDFAKYVEWKSRIHPVAQIIKLWAQMPNKQDPTYGITFKLVQVELEPSKEKSNIDILDSDAFLDSDEDETTNIESKNSVINKSSSSNSTEKLSNSTDNASSSNSKEKTKKATLIESESESESEKKSESEKESDSDGSSDIKPAKKAVAKAKSKGKK